MPSNHRGISSYGFFYSMRTSVSAMLEITEATHTTLDSIDDKLGHNTARFERYKDVVR